MVFCTICERKKIWDMPLKKECQIFGNYRHFAWGMADFHKKDFDVKFITQTPVKDFVEWILKYWKKTTEKKKSNFKLTYFYCSYLDSEKSKTNSRRKATKKGKCQNPFIDFEAEDSDEAENSGLDDEAENSGLDDEEFIDDSEIEPDEECPPNPYIQSGFFERIEQRDVLQVAQSSSSISLTDRRILEKVWAESETRMMEQGIVPWDEQKAIEEEEKRRKLAEEKEKKKKRVERKNKREIATFAYAHYGQKYDNVRNKLKFSNNF
jgi:hypothetical protein